MKEKEDIKDKNGNIKPEILEAIADRAIKRNPIIYKRLSEI
jgi:hypothetical protein